MRWLHISGKKKKKGKGGDKEGKETPATEPEEPPKEDEKPEGADEEEGQQQEESAAPPPPQTKIIIQSILRTYLYMCYGHLPEELAEKDCVYFLRNTPGMVSLPNSVDEANEDLPALIEMGVLNGHSLVMLEQVITQVGI